MVFRFCMHQGMTLLTTNFNGALKIVCMGCHKVLDPVPPPFTTLNIWLSFEKRL